MNPWEYNYGQSFDEIYDFREKKSAVGNYIAYMLNRTQCIFKYNGLPDSIPHRMLENYLQLNGYVCIARIKGELYAFFGGLGGTANSVYYQPTWCTISNPKLDVSKRLEFDKDAILIRNDAMMIGLAPLFQRYATALMENDISFDIASKNLRAAAVISAPDKRTQDAAEAFLQDMSDGKQGVIGEEPFFDGVKVQPYARAESRTLTELIEYHQYLKASWYNEIGLNANYNMKRESLSMTESQMNFDALLPLVDDMFNERKLGVKAVNEMFGTNITVELDSTWKQLHEAAEESPQQLVDESKRLDDSEAETSENSDEKDGENDDNSE